MCEAPYPFRNIHFPRYRRRLSLQLYYTGCRLHVWNREIPTLASIVFVNTTHEAFGSCAALGASAHALQEGGGTACERVRQ